MVLSLLLTCPHLVLEGDGAVLDELLEVDTPLWQIQVQQFHHLVRVMEVKHLAVAIILLLYVVNQDVHDLQEELPGRRHPVYIMWEDVCNTVMLLLLSVLSYFISERIARKVYIHTRFRKRFRIKYTDFPFFVHFPLQMNFLRYEQCFLPYFLRYDNTFSHYK